MTSRHEKVFDRIEPELQKIVIPAEARFASVEMGTHAAGVWYLGGGAIDIRGTVPTKEDLADLRKAIGAANVSIPVSFLGLEVAGETAGGDPHLREASIFQLTDQAGTALYRFWGLSPWFFPILLFAICGFSRTLWTRWCCDAGVFAWVIWIPVLSKRENLWPASFSAALIVPVLGAWIWLACARTKESERFVLRLLSPCAVMVLADALYSLVNAGVLAPHLGGGWANFITELVNLFAWVSALICALLASHGLSWRWRSIHFVVMAASTYSLMTMMYFGTYWMALDVSSDPTVEPKVACALACLILFFGFMMIYVAIALGRWSLEDPILRQSLRRPRWVTG